MRLTTFGKVLRKLRIDHDMTMAEMATLLKITPAFLSQVEVGKKSPPSQLVDGVIEKLALPGDEAASLRNAADQSRRIYRLNVEGKDPQTHTLAAAFARRFENGFENLDDEDMKRLINILNKE